MQYYSPYNLLEIFDIDIKSEVQNVDLIKKKLLAEIELNNGFIKIKDQTYSKNDVLNLVERLKDTKNGDFHLLIHNDYALKYFLENGKGGNTLVFDKNEIYKSPEFIDFISPYYSPLYTKTCVEYIDFGSNTREMNLILQNQVFVAPMHEEEAFGKVYKKINLKKEILEEYYIGFMYRGEKRSKSELLNPVATRASRLLNDHEYYAQLREDYARILINFGAELHNKYKAKISEVTTQYFWLASQLKVSAELESLSKQNYAILAGNDDTESSSSSGFQWRYVWIAVVVLRILAALF